MNKEELAQRDLYKRSKAELKILKDQDDHVSDYMTEKERMAYDLGFSTGYINASTSFPNAVENEIKAFAEWCSKEQYMYYIGLKNWYNRLGEKITTAQLLERFRKETT